MLGCVRFPLLHTPPYGHPSQEGTGFDLTPHFQLLKVFHLLLVLVFLLKSIILYVYP
jgi:hypothetical protein